jgi:hypothetical protein
MFSQKNLALFLLLIVSSAIAPLIASAVFSLIPLFLFGYLLHEAWKENPLELPGFIFGICLLILLGSAFYYLAIIPKAFVLLICAALVIPSIRNERNMHHFSLLPVLRVLPLTILPLISFFFIRAHTIQDALRSPFDQLPLTILLLIAGQVALLGYYVFRSAARPAERLLACFSLFIQIALITRVLYPLGFGFDPFIHRATIRHIIEFGTIDPKPFYYIGNYVLEVAAAHLSALPLKLINDWTAIFVGLGVLFGSAKAAFERLHPAAYIGLLLLPLGALLSSSTPQALAYFFALAAFFELSCRSPLSIKRAIALSFIGCIIHPLAGIPALLVSLYTWSRGRIPKLITHASFMAFIFALPALFLLQGTLLGAPIRISFSAPHFPSLPANHFDLFLNGAEVSMLLPALLSILFALYALRSKEAYALLLPPAFMLSQYLIFRSFFEFDFLIEYEQQNYAERFLPLTLLALAPSAAIGLSQLFKDTFAFKQGVFTLLLVLLLPFSTYASLPRNDGAERGRGFNTSIADLESVRAAHELADGKPYAVLASQATSAAALEELGFERYFHESIFFYPIPTGGPLYEAFLSFAEGGAGMNAIEAAGELTGAKQIFVILPDYWWESDILSEETKDIADHWVKIGDDRYNTVFLFTLPE